MANTQSGFPYTDEQLQTLTTYVSLERLRMYIASIKGVTDQTERLRAAIKLYEKNTAHCEAMYAVMQGFEVTFRNAIHNRLKADHNSDWWFDSFPLLYDERKRSCAPKLRLRPSLRMSPPTVSSPS